MNSIRLTKNGRKIISKESKTPLYDKPVEVRLKLAKNQLVSDNLSERDRSWNLLQLKCQILGL